MQSKDDKCELDIYKQFHLVDEVGQEGVRRVELMPSYVARDRLDTVW